MLDWLATLCLKIKVLAVLTLPPFTVDWSPHDRLVLIQFLRTQTGQRLFHVFRNAAASRALLSTRGNIPAERARGFQETFELLCRLSAIDPLQVVEPGEVSLTDQKDTSETEEKGQGEGEDDSLLGKYGYEGTSIGGF